MEAAHAAAVPGVCLGWEDRLVLGEPLLLFPYFVRSYKDFFLT